MRTIMLVTIVLMIGTGDSFAQDGVVLTSHERAAAELIEVLQLERIALAGADATAQAMANPNLAFTGQDSMIAALAEVMAEFNREFMRWEELRPEYIRMYRNAFTEAELRGLIAFYNTPIGQKSLDVTPELMRQGAEIHHKRMQPFLPELQRRILMLVRGGGGP